MALLVRVVDVVVGRVDLDRPGQRVGLGAVGRPEPPDVHLPEVELGLALHDPGGHLPTDPARPGDAVRAEAGRDEEPADVALAEDEFVVRREPLGPVDHPAHACVGDGRDAPDGAIHDLREPRPVRGEELAVEVGRDAVERPRRGLSLVAAHAQAADLLAVVDEVVGVAHGRERRDDALDRVGEQVLVGHRDDRHGDAGKAADLGGEHAAGVHDDVRLDIRPLAPVLDGHPRHAAALDADPDDPGVWPDRDPALAGARREREREPRRVEPAVRGQVDGPEDPVERHQREELVRLGRRDELDGQAERLRPAGLPTELLLPLLAGRQPQRSDLVPCGSVPVSAARRRYSSVPYIIIFVSVTELRS